ncbi:hypothetical protein P2G67_16250 [Fodinicurvata sp. CAU 1616]|uniref:Uncharacterized protein n=1 Tax=Aquibaculum arenosum TaxID=3032591 RepID=A0ABT5YRH4_9PROT|nr:hypothetical protein [Fodinicurvata sp. CAU 1616]MDF2097523.1 hypothetical protein [Fodinicurvata sp. CAU 1616]
MSLGGVVGNHHPLDQVAQLLARRLCVGRAQLTGKVCNPCAIDGGKVIVQIQNRLLLGLRKLHFQGGDFVFDAGQPVHERLGVVAVCNGVDQVNFLLAQGVQSSLRLLTLLAGRFQGGLGLGLNRLDEVGQQVRVHQAVLQAVEDQAFHLSAPDRLLLGAGAGLSRVGAADVVLPGIAHGAATGAADHQAGEEVLGTAMVPEAVLGCVALCKVRAPALAAVGRGLEAVLNLPPERLIDDAQLRNLSGDVFVGGAHPGLAQTGLVVFAILRAVPDHRAVINRVAQNARLPRRVTADGGITPGLARGAWDAVGIERLGDGDGRFALGIVPVDAPDHIGMLWMNGEDAAFVGGSGGVVAVAVGRARGVASFQDDAFQTAMGFLFQGAQELAVHHGAQPHGHGRREAVGNRIEAHVVILSFLVECRHIGHVAAQAVEGLHQDNVGAVRRDDGTQGVKPRAVNGGAGGGAVLKLGNDLPALLLGDPLAKAILVLDGLRALQVGGIACVDDGTKGLCHRSPFSLVGVPEAPEPGPVPGQSGCQCRVSLGSGCGSSQGSCCDCARRSAT